jgi:hypothetical protein
MRGRFRRWRRGSSAGWELAIDRVLAYRAPNGFDGVCHLRLFEPGGRGQWPVVIVGELSDHAGACSIVNADEWIAAQVQDGCFADGRRFVYVEHHAETIIGVPEPTFDVVHLERARRPAGHAQGDTSGESRVVVMTEEGAESHAIPNPPATPAWGWMFRAIRREPLAVHELGGGGVALDLLPGVEVRVWPTGSYTAYAVAGEEGALPLVHAADANSERADGLTGAVDAVGEAPTDAILEISTDTPPEDPLEPDDRV